MKIVTYRVRGQIDETVVPAILAAVAAIPGVRRANLSPTEEMDVTLTLWMTAEPMELQEERLADVFASKGAALILDTRTVTDTESTPVRGKRERTVPLSSAVGAMAVALVIAILLTFAVTTNYFRRTSPPTPDANHQETTVFDQMAILDGLFRDLTVHELDENFEDVILKSYVAATGDIYAEYFTEEELKAQNSDKKGEMCGIGISVVSGTYLWGTDYYQAIVVSDVYPDSPAEEAGVLPGDFIMYVGIGEDAVLVNDIGYTKALDRMSGEEGTVCSFTVFRLNQESGAYDRVELSAVRKKLTVRVVTGRTYSLDPTVGIIRITKFDDLTATQFCNVVEELKGKGCTSFVLDLRGNPGGYLTSIEDLLVLFLNEGDTILSTKDSKGRETVTKLTVRDGKILCGTGTKVPSADDTAKIMTPADIGKYRDLHFSVLVNRYTASAAELFTANMRDYDLAPIVGDRTFGKGSMQSTILLTSYGIKGALKMTTNYYYPPCGEGYDGADKGILPDIPVALDEEVKNININLLTDEQDNQLAEAVKALSPAA